MKRKIIPYLLMAAFLCGCGKAEAPASVPTSSTEEQIQVSQTETTTVATQPTTEAPVIQPTQTTSEVPTETTTVPITTTALIPTLPLPTTAPSITPPIGDVSICTHNFQPGIYQAPTCTQSGYQSYQCTKCGYVQQQVSLPLSHSYTEATCTSAQRCVFCGNTQGSSMGHSFVNGACSRCGEKDASERTITIQVKDSKDAPVDGVTVELRIEDTLHSTAVSSGGQVSFTLKNHNGSYTLVVTGVPEGYAPQKDRYTYQSDYGAIVLNTVSVIYPDDHSKAAYEVGSVMGDFTITDIDGKTHQLSRLLQEKKLVILNFWYYNCVPCKAEFPYFNSVYQRYGDDIEILAMNHIDNESLVWNLRSDMGLRFPLAMERLGFQQGFGMRSYPFSVFIGRDGRILYIRKNIGFLSEAELDDMVRKMIGQ